MLIVLVACTVNNPSNNTLAEDEEIATIVAGTLTAYPTITPIPALEVPTQSLKLENYSNKELIGENDRYSVFFINSPGEDSSGKTGEIIVYDKSNEFVSEMIGTFTFYGTTIVSNDDKRGYILLSPGTYTSRKAIVLSLNDKKQAVNIFCTSAGEFGDHLFWNDYVVFNNC